MIGTSSSRAIRMIITGVIGEKPKNTVASTTTNMISRVIATRNRM